MMAAIPLVGLGGEKAENDQGRDVAYPITMLFNEMH